MKLDFNFVFGVYEDWIGYDCFESSYFVKGLLLHKHKDYGWQCYDDIDEIDIIREEIIEDFRRNKKFGCWEVACEVEISYAQDCQGEWDSTLEYGEYKEQQLPDDAIKLFEV